MVLEKRFVRSSYAAIFSFVFEVLLSAAYGGMPGGSGAKAHAAPDGASAAEPTLQPRGRRSRSIRNQSANRSGLAADPTLCERRARCVEAWSVGLRLATIARAVEPLKIIPQTRA